MISNYSAIFIITVVTLASDFLFVPTLSAYESMYDKTPVNTIEIKTIPERVALAARGNQPYFSEDNRLFSVLFSYIKKNKVSMTVPVEVEIDRSEMRFFAGGKDAGRELQPNNGVSVQVMPAQQVASVGLRGSYNQKNFEKGKARLYKWLEQNPRYEATDPVYAVYWNGPFIPGWFKRSEVHLPIQLKETK